MKIPVSPPVFDALLHKVFTDDKTAVARVTRYTRPVDEKGRYLHWDKLRHLPPPEGLSSEEWWLAIKFSRKNLYQFLPLQDKSGAAFQFATPDKVLRETHWLDMSAAGSIIAADAITNPQTRNTYLIRSLIEEAIHSSQLEGASTTQNIAKEMIRQDRPPRDKSEQMIFNNYHAMQFIREIKNEKLTPSIVFELQRIVTDKTMEDEGATGRLRNADEDIHVVDNQTQELLHTPPPANELPQRLQALCDFANADNTNTDSEIFLHPVIKAIILHFMLAYDHPFCDGNGRTARALFYWMMAKEGYWLIEFISISRVIQQASVQYGKAFLHTETDDNDLTYFILHQLNVVRQAIEALQLFLDDKVKGINEAETLLQQNPRLRGKLNFRQLALLQHALKHPRFAYVIEEHQRTHGISYDVARKDLLHMADKLKLLSKTKQGKRYVFIVPENLEQRVRQQ